MAISDYQTRNLAEEQQVATMYPGYTIKKAQDEPYLGTTSPIYGEKLARQNPYAAIIQETSMEQIAPVAPGATLSVKIPRLGEGIDPERGDLPAGSETVAVVIWDGQSWRPLITPGELQGKLDRAIATSSSAIAQQKWKRDTDQIRGWMPLKLPKALDRYLSSADHKNEVKERISRLHRGDHDPPRRSPIKHTRTALLRTEQGKRILKRRRKEAEDSTAKKV